MYILYTICLTFEGIAKLSMVAEPFTSPPATYEDPNLAPSSLTQLFIFFSIAILIGTGILMRF